ncbi:surface layer-associated protease precursor [Aeropyrum pernix K1]|uniref:Surface layer-associated protease n=1 Tax=Aeropyrum pernix (strain ATCC 700893 / DSM 11879 / JCM 9820 / NBRC 100138 / K1) TaxID=272557 RepID=Q9YCP5_AERPE|nr:surface layer-associated protease precursor [Aeropyrum pernix K1]
MRLPYFAPAMLVFLILLQGFPGALASGYSLSGGEDLGGYGGYPAPLAMLVDSLGEEGLGLGDLEALGVAVPVVVYLEPWADAGALLEEYGGLVWLYRGPLVSLVGGALGVEDLLSLAGEPGVSLVVPAGPLRPVAKAEELPPDVPRRALGAVASASTEGGVVYDRPLRLTGALEAWEMGYRGEGVVIGVIDTGVDFSGPGLGEDKIAFSPEGLPLIVDYGMVFLAAPLYVEVDPDSGSGAVDFQGLYTVEAGPAGVGLLVKRSGGFASIAYLSPEGGYSSGYVEYSLEPPVLPQEVVDAALQGGAPPRYGLAVSENMAYTLDGGLLWYRMTVPGLVADADADGLYDTIYLDASTAVYHLASAARQAGLTLYPAPSAADYSFEGEKPVTPASPLAGYDARGDGDIDLPVGALAGYTVDLSGAALGMATGILGEMAAGLPEGGATLLPTEDLPAGYLLPGMDFWRGSYAVFHTDDDGHGTKAASTAAGREFIFRAETGLGLEVRMLVSGTAPEARLAASSFYIYEQAMLTLTGHVMVDAGTGEPLWIPPWMGGVDPWDRLDPRLNGGGVKAEWAWTGTPLVDLTTNSWGISSLQYYADKPLGLEEVSLFIDSITLETGVPHFIAAGNGGPGLGTVTAPATARLAVAVAAATDMAYLSLIQPGYLPLLAGLGGYGDPAYFSARGPSHAGAPKPGLAAIGGFAYTTGRSLDHYTGGRLDPRAAPLLFGGTSMATPMAAGAAALAIQALKESLGVERLGLEEWLRVYTALSMTAQWRGLPWGEMGNGIVDAAGAIRLLTGVDQGVLIYSATILEEAAGQAGVAAPGYGIPALLVWAGSGVETPVDIVLEGEGPVALKAVEPRLEVTVRSSVEIDLSSPVGESGYYTMYNAASIDPSMLPQGPVEVSLTLPYEVFDRQGRERTSTWWEGYVYGVLALLYWADLDGDGLGDDGEFYILSIDKKSSNVFRVFLSNAQEALAGAREALGWSEGVREEVVLRLALAGLSWAGGTTRATVEIAAISWVESSALSLPATVEVEGEAVVEAVVNPPEPGVYTGFIVASTGVGEYRMPYTILSPYRPSHTGVHVPQGLGPDEYYEEAWVRGAFDYSWWYEDGDWRIVPLELPGPGLAVARLHWPVEDGREAYATNIDAYLYLNRPSITVSEAGEVVVGVEEMALASREASAANRFFDPTLTGFWDQPGSGPGETVLAAYNHAPGRVLLVYRSVQYSGETARQPVVITLYHTPVSTRGTLATGETTLASVSMASLYRLGNHVSTPLGAGVEAYHREGGWALPPPGASASVEAYQEALGGHVLHLSIAVALPEEPVPESVLVSIDLGLSIPRMSSGLTVTGEAERVESETIYITLPTG